MNTKSKKTIVSYKNSVFRFIETGIIFSLVLFIVDYYDILSKIILQFPGKVIIVSSVLLGLLILIWLHQISFFDLFRMHYWNFIDLLCALSCFVPCVYGASIFLVGKISPYKIFICCYSILFGSIGCMFRYLGRCQIETIIERNNSKLFELIDIYENRILRYNKKSPIFVIEKAADYDLLEREGIINHLYRSIIYSHSEQSFVISLEGAWGSGKTTIIKNAVKHLEMHDDIVIINNFDPWLYGSQEALLLAMYEILLGQTGFKYSPFRSHQMYEDVKSIISEKYIAGSILQKIVHHSQKPYESLEIVKQHLSSFLLSSGKKFVFIIDNIDRASRDNVILLFKLISIIFDLPNIIYLLSFERERINSIFEDTDEVDRHFTEKIIQEVITVNLPSASCCDKVYTTCCQNLLRSYGIDQFALNDYEIIIRTIEESSKGLRSFIRLINSVFSIVYCDDNLLYKRDLLGIEIIGFYDRELYDFIRHNPRLFISHERVDYDFWDGFFTSNEITEKRRVQFDEIAIKHREFISLLSVLFPVFREYVENNNKLGHFVIPSSSDTDIVKKAAICSGKYFDLYFAYGSNSYLQVKEKIESYLSQIKSCSKPKRAIELLHELTNTMVEGNQGEFLLRILNYLDDFPDEIIAKFVEILFTSIWRFSRNSDGLFSAPRIHAEKLIARLLQRCNDADFIKAKNKIFGGYRYLDAQYRIWQCIKAEENRSTENGENNRAPILYESFSTSVKEILSKPIDLYSAKYYSEGNAVALQWYLESEVEQFRKYISEILVPNHIYRILWDAVDVAISSTVSYSLSEENLSRYFSDISNVTDMVKQRAPRSEDERFVYAIYQAYLSGNKDALGRTGIESSHQRSLNL